MKEQAGKVLPCLLCLSSTVWSSSGSIISGIEGLTGAGTRNQSKQTHGQIKNLHKQYLSKQKKTPNEKKNSFRRITKKIEKKNCFHKSTDKSYNINKFNLQNFRIKNSKTLKNEMIQIRNGTWNQIGKQKQNSKSSKPQKGLNSCKTL